MPLSLSTDVAARASQAKLASQTTSQGSQRSYRPSLRSQRSSQAGAGGQASQRSHRSVLEKATGAKEGWVTLVKDGEKLVSSRLRLDISTRQQHSQQWSRRLGNDRVAEVLQRQRV